MRTVAKAVLATSGAWLGLRAFAALRPTAFPYFARRVLDLPRPLITRRGLLDILRPAAGERLLEIGPGTGYYTLAVAAQLEPGGIVEIIDVRRRFLDETLQRGHEHGLSNIVPMLGDATCLPYADGAFDAAYVISVIGELPDPDLGLVELRRVLKPRGRLVVGEIFIDPDFPRRGWLERRARTAGLVLERRSGGPLGYFARFRPDVERTEESHSD
jgi:ubiquinone/menaquinone biosynthesis C-methylase UbiE